VTEHIELTGQRVTLRTTVRDDGPALIAIRETDEVRHRWHGDDLEAEFLADFDDDETVRLTIRSKSQFVGLVQFSEENDPDYRHNPYRLMTRPFRHQTAEATEATIR